MDQATYNKITAGTSIFSVAAAFASAITAYLLYDITATQREFILRQNATQTVRDWQLNTTEKSKSGFLCVEYLTNLISEKSLFKSAWKKEEYYLEGKPKQEQLKKCLNRENRVEIKELGRILSIIPYKSTSVHIPQDVSKFVTTQAIDYLNFTEALYMPWKYKTAEGCIIIEQLGVDTSDNLRSIVVEKSANFPATYKFLETYKTTDDVRNKIEECRKKGFL